MTPRSTLGLADSDAIASYAPRILNAPIACRLSALRQDPPRRARTARAACARRRRAGARPRPGCRRARRASCARSFIAAPGRSRSGTRCNGPPRAGPRAAPAAIGRPQRRQRRTCRLESGEGRLDQLELLHGPVAQGEIALLLEDLAGRGGLRAVGHLARRAMASPSSVDATARARPRARCGQLPDRSTPWPECTLARAARALPFYTPREYRRRFDHGDRDRSRSAGWRSTRRRRSCRPSTTGRRTGSAARAACSSSSDDPEKYLDPDYTPSM